MTIPGDNGQERNFKVMLWDIFNMTNVFLKLTKLGCGCCDLMALVFASIGIGALKFAVVTTYCIFSDYKL